MPAESLSWLPRANKLQAETEEHREETLSSRWAKFEIFLRYSSWALRRTTGSTGWSSEQHTRSLFQSQVWHQREKRRCTGDTNLPQKSGNLGEACKGEPERESRKRTSLRIHHKCWWREAHKTGKARGHLRLAGEQDEGWDHWRECQNSTGRGKGEKRRQAQSVYISPYIITWTCAPKSYLGRKGWILKAKALKFIQDFDTM